MDRDLLAHLPVVVTVDRQMGFAAAAEVLNMSASAVSHAVKSVEDRLGEPLFARTTRSVSLTEAGAKLIATVSPLPAAVAPWSIVVAVFLGAGVGIAAGVYPASRASRLDPITALRAET